MRLLGMNSVVTAAGSGIGKAIALGFSQHGAKVVCADIDRSAAEQTAQTIQAAGGEAIHVEVDVANKGQVENLFSVAIMRSTISIFCYPDQAYQPHVIFSTFQKMNGIESWT